MPPPPTTPAPPPAGARERPLHVVQVLSDAGAEPGGHVRSLAAGLVARGVRVTVCAPPAAGPAREFAGAGAHFASLPVRRRARALAVLRSVSAPADVMHAHGLGAGLLAALALRGRDGVALVVTWHARARLVGVPAPAVRLLERRVVRAARVVLGATSELVDRARRHGARDARLAPVALPAAGDGPVGAPGDGEAATVAHVLSVYDELRAP
ncbi:glycosyltransferase [Streptomyces sp. TRM70308]|uniref:glycosyltransferase n=1 Tax=Streptomyces sp. TRM70308 TaxID=3131932 RepID=UPI003D075813